MNLITPEWIFVKDQLPPYGESVWWFDQGMLGITAYYGDCNQWSHSWHPPTHWALMDPESKALMETHDPLSIDRHQLLCRVQRPEWFHPEPLELEEDEED